MVQTTETPFHEERLKSPAVFEIENVTISYGHRPVVRNVTLNLPETAVTAILGASGCGKTTLLRSLNRMTDSAIQKGVRVEGSIRYRGVDIATMDPVDVRTRVGMIFQRPNPFPKSIRDNVLFGPQILGTERKDHDNILETALERAGLWHEVKDRLGKSALELSGGQQQRLCIARALAINPDVLLMDEPCSQLDPTATTKVEDTIYQLKKGGVSIVIVTHNIGQARRISDHIAFFDLVEGSDSLYAGELVEFGTNSQIVNFPQDPRTLGFLTGKFG